MTARSINEIGKIAPWYTLAGNAAASAIPSRPAVSGRRRRNPNHNAAHVPTTATNEMARPTVSRFGPNHEPTRIVYGYRGNQPEFPHQSSGPRFATPTHRS
jgi:hypothetical protein